MSGLTLDTGALIALERGNPRARALIASVRGRRERITVPAAVIAEWWRGQRGPVARLLDAFDIEPLERGLAERAGEALARTAGPSAVDAIVMASAARRGDRVLTGDVDDLTALRGVFPNVTVLGLGSGTKR